MLRPTVSLPPIKSIITTLIQTANISHPYYFNSLQTTTLLALAPYGLFLPEHLEQSCYKQIKCINHINQYKSDSSLPCSKASMTPYLTQTRRQCLCCDYRVLGFSLLLFPQHLSHFPFSLGSSHNASFNRSQTTSIHLSRTLHSLLSLPGMLFSGYIHGFPTIPPPQKPSKALCKYHLFREFSDGHIKNYEILTSLIHIPDLFTLLLPPPTQSLPPCNILLIVNIYYLLPIFLY